MNSVRCLIHASLASAGRQTVAASGALTTQRLDAGRSSRATSSSSSPAAARRARTHKTRRFLLESSIPSGSSAYSRPNPSSKSESSSCSSGVRGGGPPAGGPPAGGPSAGGPVAAAGGVPPGGVVRRVGGGVLSMAGGASHMVAQLSLGACACGVGLTTNAVASRRYTFIEFRG